MTIDGKVLKQQNLLPHQEKQQQQQQQQQQHQPHFTAVVRATDKSSRFAEAPWKIFVSGERPQTFYKIAMEVEVLDKLRPLFVEKYFLASYINAFFKGDHFQHHFFLIHYFHIPSFCYPRWKSIQERKKTAHLILILYWYKVSLFVETFANFWMLTENFSKFFLGLRKLMCIIHIICD